MRDEPCLRIKKDNLIKVIVGIGAVGLLFAGSSLIATSNKSLSANSASSSHQNAAHGIFDFYGVSKTANYPSVSITPTVTPPPSTLIPTLFPTAVPTMLPTVEPTEETEEPTEEPMEPTWDPREPSLDPAFSQDPAFTREPASQNPAYYQPSVNNLYYPSQFTNSAYGLAAGQAAPGSEVYGASAIIGISGLAALGFAFINLCFLSRIRTRTQQDADRETPLVVGGDDEEKTALLQKIQMGLNDCATCFLRVKYAACSVCVAIVGTLVTILVAWGTDWDISEALFTSIAFAVGAATTMAAGYLGTKACASSVDKVIVSARELNYAAGFSAGFRASSVMGFLVGALAILMLYGTMLVFRLFFGEPDEWVYLIQSVSGVAMGSCIVAMFSRVGGGMYAKASVVAAELFGRMIDGVAKDDPRNPSFLSSIGGHNIGILAGVGSDLFSSLVEALCAALVIGSSIGLFNGWEAMLFPLAASGAGIIVCMVCSFVAHLVPARLEHQVTQALKTQFILTALLTIPAVFGVAVWILPYPFTVASTAGDNVLYLEPWKAAACVSMGSVGGLLIGLISQFCMNHTKTPVLTVANATKTGASTNIAYGMALGYKSTVIPFVFLAMTIYGSFTLCEFYGMALAAVGFLCNVATGLAIDLYRVVCNSARVIADTTDIDSATRRKTAGLDGAGNATAAIGRVISVVVGCITAFVTFGAFLARARQVSNGEWYYQGVNFLEPLTLSLLMVGGMIPFVIAGFTMKGVGEVAETMVKEVQRQFEDNSYNKLEGDSDNGPNYSAYIFTSARASLKQIVPILLIAFFAPLLTGILFGMPGVTGLLVGTLAVSAQLAVGMLNAGTAWDNVKHIVDQQGRPSSEQEGEVSETHKAALEGKLLGEFKDPAGNALIIAMKLMVVSALVFADTFYSVNYGKGILGN